MKLGLTYDLRDNPADPWHAEFDSPATIQTLVGALEGLGHDVKQLGSAMDLLQAPERLRGVELVFNIAEGREGRCREAYVPTLLDLYHVPYVGSDPLALSLGLDKLASKRLAVASNLLTPSWMAIDHPAQLPSELPLRFPVIVKLRYGGSGMGLDSGAVVDDLAALRQRVGWLWESWHQAMLIETFVPYGELTVCVIGNDSPVAYPAIQRPIDPATRLACHLLPQVTTWEAPLVLTPALDDTARHVAVTMFEALGCRDMARVDVRVDECGRVFFLEINPLPSFDPEGSFGLLAEHLQVSYQQVIGWILDAARARRSPSGASTSTIRTCR